MTEFRHERRARFQISENTLFAAGLDRPTVEALRHILNKVGVDGGTTSLPDTVIGVESLTLVPAVQPPMPAADDLTPAMQVAQQVEFLQTEVRELAEQVAALNVAIQDLKQGITA